MPDELTMRLNMDALLTILRTNLSSHLGKVLTSQDLDEISTRIAESIEFFLNKK